MLRSLGRTAGGRWVATFAAFIALLVLGCGSSDGSPATGGTVASGTSPSTPAASSAPDASSAGASPSSTAAAGGSVGGATGTPDAPVASAVADAELEALLPREIRGLRLTTFSARGDEFVNEGAELGQGYAEFLARLGRSPADVSIAAAADETGTLEGQIAAIRVAGADPSLLVDAFVAAQRAESGGSLEVETRDVGGRQVTVLIDQGDAPNDPAYVYAQDEIVFVVQTADEELAAEALRLLP